MAQRSEFVLRSPRDRDEAPDEEALVQAIKETEITVPGGFFVLQRGDGAFVQYDGSQLEWGVDGRLYRFDTGHHAREACRRLVEGKDLDNVQSWRDVTWELDAAQRSRKATARNLIILGVFVAGIVMVGWYLLSRASLI